MEDVYLSIAGREVRETRVQGSRFIAEAIPVRSREVIDAEVEAIRKREFKASHHCSGFRLGQAREVFGFSDAREPVGTAGPPILRQIDARLLTYTLVVVTRYFGGTKLGTGGLIRAYADAAAEALDACTLEEHVVRTRVRLRFGYHETSPVMHLLGQFDTEVQDTRYAEDTELVVGVRRSQVTPFCEAYREAMSGREVEEVMEEAA